MADTEDQKSGLPSFSTTTLAIIGILIASPFAIYYFRRGDIGRGLVCLVAGIALIFVISARWNLRKLPWFWVTIAIVVLINTALIILVPWPNGKGIRGPVLGPFVGAFVALDYFVVWIAIKIMAPSELKNS